MKAEFLAAITCKHGHTIAPSCAQGCHRENWLDSIVKTAPGELPRTVGDVVSEFVPTRIPTIEIVSRYIDERGQPTKTQTVQKLAVAAGATIVGGVLLYEGGKLVLRLLANIRSRNDEKPRG